MTLADDIAAIWEEAAPDFVEVFHADLYEIRRKPMDGNAGWDGSQAWPVIETGRCALTDTSQLSREQQGQHVMVSLSPYTVELPKGTLLTQDDRIVINGREFLVEGPPKRPGLWDPGFVTAGLSERTP